MMRGYMGWNGSSYQQSLLEESVTGGAATRPALVYAPSYTRPAATTTPPSTYVPPKPTYPVRVTPRPTVTAPYPKTNCQIDRNVLSDFARASATNDTSLARSMEARIAHEKYRLQHCPQQLRALREMEEVLDGIIKCQIDKNVLSDFAKSMAEGKELHAVRARIEHEQYRLKGCSDPITGALRGMLTSLNSLMESKPEVSRPPEPEYATAAQKSKTPVPMSIQVRSRFVPEFKKPLFPVLRRKAPLGTSRWTPEELAELERAKKVAKSVGMKMSCTDAAQAVFSKLVNAQLRGLRVIKWRWAPGWTQHSAVMVWPERLTTKSGVVLDQWWANRFGSSYPRSLRPGGSPYRGAYRKPVWGD